MALAPYLLAGAGVCVTGLISEYYHGKKLENEATRVINENKLLVSTSGDVQPRDQVLKILFVEAVYGIVRDGHYVVLPGTILIRGCASVVEDRTINKEVIDPILRYAKWTIFTNHFRPCIKPLFATRSWPWMKSDCAPLFTAASKWREDEAQEIEGRDFGHVDELAPLPLLSAEDNAKVIYWKEVATLAHEIGMGMNNLFIQGPDCLSNRIKSNGGIALTLDQNPSGYHCDILPRIFEIYTPLGTISGYSKFKEREDEFWKKHKTEVLDRFVSKQSYKTNKTIYPHTESIMRDRQGNSLPLAELDLTVPSRYPFPNPAHTQRMKADKQEWNRLRAHIFRNLRNYGHEHVVSAAAVP